MSNPCKVHASACTGIRTSPLRLSSITTSIARSLMEEEADVFCFAAEPKADGSFWHKVKTHPEATHMPIEKCVTGVVR